jgi:hypothetical protein
MMMLVFNLLQTVILVSQIWGKFLDFHVFTKDSAINMKSSNHGHCHGQMTISQTISNEVIVSYNIITQRRNGMKV